MLMARAEWQLPPCVDLSLLQATSSERHVCLESKWSFSVQAHLRVLSYGEREEELPNILDPLRVECVPTFLSLTPHREFPQEFSYSPLLHGF